MLLVASCFPCSIVNMNKESYANTVLDQAAIKHKLLRPASPMSAALQALSLASRNLQVEVEAAVNAKAREWDHQLKQEVEGQYKAVGTNKGPCNAISSDVGGQCWSLPGCASPVADEVSAW